jgi:RimJ/RimL family protein N-acetyltransferase
VTGDPVSGDYPRTVVLKDGAHLVLRPMTEADREGVAARLGAAPPAEAVVVVACEDKRVAGLLTLERRGDAGRLRIVLDPAYRERRLGTWMLLDAVHLAGALGLRRLEACPDREETAYRAALARLDFVEERLPGGAIPGMLVKTLHVGWPDF